VVKVVGKANQKQSKAEIDAQAEASVLIKYQKIRYVHNAQC